LCESVKLRAFPATIQTFKGDKCTARRTHGEIIAAENIGPQMNYMSGIDRSAGNIPQQPSA
jgi:hypothetical protein